MKDLQKGNAQSDLPQPIDKKVVLALVQKEIDKLEKHETRIMNQDIFDDDLLLLEEDKERAANYSLAAHATTASSIMDLKSLYKKIEKL